MAARPVLLHVYDLHHLNSWLHPAGFGAYHTGVEIGGREYTFGEGGVVSTTPLSVPNHRVSLEVGQFRGSANDVSGVVSALRREFLGDEYDVAQNNCNHFSTALCAELLGGSPVPSWVNRCATWCGCCLASAGKKRGNGSNNNNNNNNSFNGGAGGQAGARVAAGGGSGGGWGVGASGDDHLAGGGSGGDAGGRGGSTERKGLSALQREKLRQVKLESERRKAERARAKLK